MKKLEWDEKRLIELGDEFLQRVLENMEAENGVSVQFGIKGKGIRPNYQIIRADGSVMTLTGYHGAHHLSVFKPENVSAPLELDLVENAWASA
ncbi:MAG: hypothetical protein MI747_11975 [Desulfobacterales bacterium]|nr:hypothetical protein [Desulfobacterales bacterium]